MCGDGVHDVLHLKYTFDMSGMYLTYRYMLTDICEHIYVNIYMLT